MNEWFRVSAMPETILVRDDWLLAVEHVHVLRSLLHQLYLQANAPVPVTGVKHWSTKLTGPQRETLWSLPTRVSSGQELAHAHVELSRAFLAVARPLTRSLGVEWPEELERAATRHVADTLGIDDPYPR